MIGPCSENPTPEEISTLSRGIHTRKNKQTVNMSSSSSALNSQVPLEVDDARGELSKKYTLPVNLARAVSFFFSRFKSHHAFFCCSDKRPFVFRFPMHLVCNCNCIALAVRRKLNSQLPNSITWLLVKRLHLKNLIVRFGFLLFLFKNQLIDIFFFF